MLVEFVHCRWQPVLLAMLFLLVNGCHAGLSFDDGSMRPWHEYYKPLSSKEADSYVWVSLAWLKENYGSPVNSVKKVYLRKSLKKWSAKKYKLRERFQLTECEDKNKGIYVIYLPVDQSHPEFFPLLGHEICHLLDVDLVGPATEGFCSVISRELAEIQGVDWSIWKERFAKDDTLYGRSYRAMSKLQDISPSHFMQMRNFTYDIGRQRELDVQFWIKALDANKQQDITKYLLEYKDVVPDNY